MINSSLICNIGGRANKTSLGSNENNAITDNDMSELQMIQDIPKNNLKLGFWDYDIKQDISYFSKQLLELFRIDPNTNLTLSLKKCLDFIHCDNRDSYYQTVLKSILNKANFSTELSMLRADGERFDATIQAEILLNESGEPIRLIGIIEDVTTTRRLLKDLHETESTFQNIAHNLQAGIWSYDISAKHYWTSQGIEKITGYSPEQFNKILWDSLIHPEDVEAYQAKQPTLYHGENLFHQYRIIHKNGNVVWVQDQTLPVLDDNGNLIRLDGIITDISAQKKYEQKIMRLAYHDYLTDLPNRTLFDQQVASLIESYKHTQEEFSIMYLDLDRFRSINNSLGHLVGDKLLQQICSRLKEVLQENAMLARIGGDEFAVLLTETNQADYPVVMAKKIIDSLGEAFIIADYELKITTSVGISSFPANGQSVEELMKNADIALYRAKHYGKNTYQIYSPSLNIDSFKKYYLERDLRKSINNNELRIHFQPRVESSTGKIVSAEALIRWEHPVWGMVSPREFIPLAEETGFVNDIGDWVLKQSCLFLKEWTNENLPIIPISINISAQRFLKNDWKETIISILEETSTDPSLIEFEITETTIIQYEKPVEAALEYLREIGIRIALDDFGTGYSSLSYIHKFPISTVKIDQSFTRQITKSESVEVILKSLILMTKGLNLNVVAEGVETIEQLAFLKEQECQEIQGYLYSKPVPEEEFRTLLHQQILKVSFEDQLTQQKNRRKHFRIPLTFPIKAEMTLSLLHGEKVQVGTTEILIEDIGPGGLRFLSNIHLPVRTDIFYNFETTILGNLIQLNGKIAWKEEVKGIYEYGVELTIDSQAREKLIKILNDFQDQLRQHPVVPNSNIFREDRFTYLKQLRSFQPS
ncbi:PAS domain S-box-containing protein/diguanylate cyclase (GGDEF) domain-containing protein [Oceanobacillus limi]|uniref:PAS domain S-box-containing protein/diguanylate cyclase (GGDEF) domain-containing protein n=1 Tax=Oceanobacillus limi TaxID=930131 RepID=A0A1I0BIQ3_9BACI|nr:EAL domain-containing protein [Oceanobacillus limi]SET06444.1 PAS domain S-box-containing protein/diguanylate cyclase (GGDEF) domain-containing protein [Oceanobacillus limi]